MNVDPHQYPELAIDEAKKALGQRARDAEVDANAAKSVLHSIDRELASPLGGDMLLAAQNVVHMLNKWFDR